MKPGSRIETLLDQYAEWHNAPPPDLWVNSGSSPTTEVINGEAVTCKPDGGMANFVNAHNRMMRIERAARMVQDVLPFLPDYLKQVFDATYVGLPREVPRMERDAAARMGVSLTKYQKLKFGLMCFFMGVNYQGEAVMFDQPKGSTKR